jgi:hypothetical protein
MPSASAISCARDRSRAAIAVTSTSGTVAALEEVRAAAVEGRPAGSRASVRAPEPVVAG